MTIDEMISVLQAAKAGKPIQQRYKESTNWVDTVNPPWDFYRYDYRAKPEPQSLYVNFYVDSCGGAYATEVMAKAAAKKEAVRVAVHFREVLE